MNEGLRQRWLESLLAERNRRRADSGYADEAKEELLAELREMAERLAATGGPRTDDLSVAEHMAIALFMPVDEAERQRHETVVDAWCNEHGYLD